MKKSPITRILKRRRSDLLEFFDDAFVFGFGGGFLFLEVAPGSAEGLFFELVEGEEDAADSLGAEEVVGDDADTLGAFFGEVWWGD